MAEKRQNEMYENFDYIKMAEAFKDRIVWIDDYRKMVNMFWGLSTLLYDLGLPTPFPRIITRTVLEYMQHTDRKYHSPIHVLSMFEWAEKHNIELSKAQQLAIWFHDSIYVPIREDSEERSSLFMKALVGETNPPDVLPEAQCIILSTKCHLKNNILIPDNAKLVMDLDLSHFAREEEILLCVDQLIREEFVSVVGEKEYKKGKKNFFDSLLARESIFRTDLFKEKFEIRARENIEKLVNNIS